MSTSRDPENPDMFTDPIIQNFIAWVGENSCPGAILKPESLEPLTFVPDTAISNYFSFKRERDQTKIRRLIEAATQQSSVPVNARSVAHSCPKVFTILVLIGQSRFIPSFVGNGRLHDRHLPFRADEARLFPKHEGDATFFEEFNKQQWRFCVGKMIQSLEPLQIDDPIVLPIIRVENLSKGVGASAVVRKIEVHQDYDDLVYPTDDEENGEQTISSEPHVYVVKSYHHPDAETYFKAEVDAFRKLNEAARPVPNLVGFYGAFMQNGSFNIILQYANLGTLEDYFTKVRPPRLGEDVLTLWRNLFRLNDALIEIHSLSHTSKAEHPRIFQGWHQDIKPANILVAGNIDSNRYDVLFMLADLGVTHFSTVVEEKSSLTGEDYVGGTRAYSSPEFNLRPRLVNTTEKQKNDTWSLACVFSEVNAWIVEGNDGLDNFRTECRREIATQGGDSKGGCFHNHRGSVLETVKRWHNHHLPPMSAKQDHVTAIIWRELLQHIFKPSGHRLDAPQVQSCATSVLQQARDELRLPPTRRATPSPAAYDAAYPSFEQNNSSSTVRAQTPPEIPPEYRASTGHLITPPPENQPRKSRTMESRHNGRLTPSPDSLKSSGSPPNILNHVYHHSPTSDSQSPRIPRDLDLEGLRRPFSADFGYMQEGKTQAVADEGAGHHSQSAAHRRNLTSPNVTGSYLGLPAALNPKFLQNLSIHEEPNQHNLIPASNATMEPSTTLPSPPESSDKTSSKGKERLMNGPPPPTQGKDIKKPPREMTVTELDTWAKVTRASSIFAQRENFLPYEKDVNLGELKKRDHIFIIDDSQSMRHHWSQMQSLYANLIYLVKKKKLDPNGSELRFIISDEHKEAKDTTELVQMVGRIGKQLRGESNFAARLNDIWDLYRKKLESRWTSARPISLYVLTDGKWQSGNRQLEMVARAFKRIVEYLEKEGLRDKMVGIQFIRFGDDPVGMTRLRWLDAGLKKDWDLARDICDTTSAEGNVWKMMLGSINDYWDDDPDD